MEISGRGPEYINANYILSSDFPLLVKTNYVKGDKSHL